jgi:hypothetical protein
LRYKEGHEEEGDGGRERGRVRKTEIPSTNVEKQKTEKHVFLEC